MKTKFNTLLSFLLFFFFCIPSYSQFTECGTKKKAAPVEFIEHVNIINPEQVITIPVIFHVLYNTGKQNIHDSIILQSLEVLNADYRAINADLASLPDEFEKDKGQPNINFVLADTLPGGVKTTGIIRKYTRIGEFKYNKTNMFRESPVINSKSYLNVYICNINTNGVTTMYAQSSNDGIVVNYEKTGKAFRTITHETGHWLGLYHIFGDKCSDDEDEIDDTPKQVVHFHVCPTYPCSDCGHSEMFMNFMDYSSCRYFFTIGQVEHMRKYISKYKKFKYETR